MNTAKSPFRKFFKIVLIVIFGLVVLGYLVGDPNSNERSVSETQKQTSEKVSKEMSTNSPKKEETSKHIPGIEPVDIYGNFEKRGFKVDKQIDVDGSFFIATLEEDGISYEAKVFCEKDVSDVTTIRFSATRTFPQYNKVEDMKPFLKFGCTVPYDGADIEKISAFIEKNFFKDKASTNISGVKFTIYCPTKFYRMIDIERG